MSDSLELDVHGGVARLWMNRADRHNAFDATLILELHNAFTALEAREDVRVVVLGARGKSFSAGADLAWMRAAVDCSLERNLDDARVLARMLHRLHTLSKPTIARVQGAALGGGVGLVAACDIAIACSTAQFATTEVRFGIIPATIGPYVVSAIGARQASRWFLTARRHSAQEALSAGLVHEVVDTDALDAAVDRTVVEVLAGGPAALAASKSLIDAVADRPLGEALIEDTAQRIARIRVTPEAQDGLRAFLDKREPAWRKDRS